MTPLEKGTIYCKLPRVRTPEFLERVRKMNTLFEEYIKEREELGLMVTIEVPWGSRNQERTPLLIPDINT